MVKGNRYELEPKDDFKERLGYSPDFFDCACIGFEGARQRGFQIETIGRDVDVKSGNREDWLAIEQEKYKRDLKRHLPSYA